MNNSTDHINVPGRFALLCNHEGVVIKTLHDESDLSKLSGKSFPVIVDKSDFQKALSFLVRLKNEGIAADWEFNISTDNRSSLAYCSGLVTDDGLLIFGTNSRSDMKKYFEEMMKINNRQTNMIRRITKENIELTSARSDAEINMYDEISRLNNELINLQRELVKKNKELERLYKQVENLSLTDPLTEVYNRRGLYKIAAREIERTRRFGYRLSVIMLDIDHFKRINDTHGHSAGDRILHELITRCKVEVRGVDVIGRIGGEEFCILLPGTGLNDAIKIAERMRTIIYEKHFKADGNEIEVTVSLGVAEYTSGIDDLDKLFQAADKAMYRAKYEGRNRVFAY